MKKFKDNQKVTHPKYGEGIIKHGIHDYWVLFSEVETRMRTVGDDFYNQLEAVEDLPNVGEYAYFWNDGMLYAIYGKYNGKLNRGKYNVKVETYKSAFFDNISKTSPFNPNLNNA